MKKPSSLTRRDFLGLSAGTAAFFTLKPLMSVAASRTTTAAPIIEKITVLRVPGEFYRSVGMNAYDRAPKGKTGQIDLVRLILSDGTQGLGVRGYVAMNEDVVAGLQRLIGVNPLDVYTWDGDRITGTAPTYREFMEDARYAFFETALLDVVGKLREKPVYALFGDAVRDGVDCYDGTLYFADIANDRDASLIGEIAARIKADGYRSIKMKVGRPSKWLPGEAGVERDIEAVIAAREAVGSNFLLMADANNGYRDQFDWAVRFLEGVNPYDLHWIEEIFPETVEDYQRLRRVMYERGIITRIAEGENALWSANAAIKDVDGFRPWLEAGLFDVIQPDMRTVGFSNTLRQADMAARFNRPLVPHNWQSEMGKIMSIHAARIKRNITFAEDDRWNNFALDTSDYVFRDGQWFMPETPGWGVELSNHYERFARAAEERVIA